MGKRFDGVHGGLVLPFHAVAGLCFQYVWPVCVEQSIITKNATIQHDARPAHANHGRLT